MDWYMGSALCRDKRCELTGTGDHTSLLRPSSCRRPSDGSSSSTSGILQRKTGLKTPTEAHMPKTYTACPRYNAVFVIIESRYKRGMPQSMLCSVCPEAGVIIEIIEMICDITT